LECIDGLATGAPTTNSATTSSEPAWISLSYAMSRAQNPRKWEDYPLVKFFDKTDWTQKQDGDIVELGTVSKCGRTNAAQGINSSAWYIEDSTGNIIDSFRLADIRNLLHRLFGDLASCSRTRTSWGAMTFETTEAVYTKVE